LISVGLLRPISVYYYWNMYTKPMQEQNNATISNMEFKSL